MSSSSVCNHTRDKQIWLPLRGRLILLPLVWLQTELNSTQSDYHYLSCMKITHDTTSRNCLTAVCVSIRSILHSVWKEKLVQAPRLSRLSMITTKAKTTGISKVFYNLLREKCFPFILSESSFSQTKKFWAKLYKQLIFSSDNRFVWFNNIIRFCIVFDFIRFYLFWIAKKHRKPERKEN